jgi:hypothetical protein
VANQPRRHFQSDGWSYPYTQPLENGAVLRGAITKGSPLTAPTAPAVVRSKPAGAPASNAMPRPGFGMLVCPSVGDATPRRLSCFDDRIGVAHAVRGGHQASAGRCSPSSVTKILPQPRPLLCSEGIEWLIVLPSFAFRSWLSNPLTDRPPRPGAPIFARNTHQPNHRMAPRRGEGRFDAALPSQIATHRPVRGNPLARVRDTARAARSI